MNFYGETHFDCHEHYPPIALENCTMVKKEERGQLPWYTQYNDMRTPWNNSKVNNCLLNVLSFNSKMCHAPCLASKYFNIDQNLFYSGIYHNVVRTGKIMTEFATTPKMQEKQSVGF